MKRIHAFMFPLIISLASCGAFGSFIKNKPPDIDKSGQTENPSLVEPVNNETGCVIFYADRDFDGYGNSEDTRCIYTETDILDDIYTVENSDDCNDASGDINPGATEICNNIDDNCINGVDEGCSCASGESRDCYSGADATNNVGECKSGIQICINWAWDICASEIVPVSEIFDGLDNDCDGTVDNGVYCFDGETKACALQAGLCDGSFDTCINNEWQGCTEQNYLNNNPLYEEIEVSCDHNDNDCNGITDDNCECIQGERGECYSGDQKTKNIGLCKSGERECTSSNKWGDCIGEILPLDEIYDGYDNNCDGNVDENLECIDGNTKPCGNQTGVCDGTQYLCQGGRWTGCDSSSLKKELGNIYEENETLCDNLDNDCDDKIDEDNICFTSYYCDNDGDGYFSFFESGSCNAFNCVLAGCKTIKGDDCNDSNLNITNVDDCELNSSNISYNKYCPYNISYTQGEEMVDILFVVDNSPSMENEQGILAKNFRKFISKLEENSPSDIDYHIGVVTTTEFNKPITQIELFKYEENCDSASNTRTGNRCEEWVNEGSGKLQHSYWDKDDSFLIHENKYITKDNLSDFPVTESCTNILKIDEPEDCAFAEFALVGMGGHFAESGLISAELALTGKGGNSAGFDYNSGFLRTDALLNVIFISDSDDLSNVDDYDGYENATQRASPEYAEDFGTNWKEDRTVNYYYNYFKNNPQLKSNSSLVDLYGIVFTMNSLEDSGCKFDEIPSTFDDNGEPYFKDGEKKYAARYSDLISQFYNDDFDLIDEHLKDICDNELGDIIEGIGSSIGTKLSLLPLYDEDTTTDIPSFNDTNPDELTMQVSLNNKIVDSYEWSYDSSNKAISLNTIPAFDDVVEIYYDEIHKYSFTFNEKWVDRVDNITILDRDISQCTFSPTIDCYTLNIAADGTSVVFIDATFLDTPASHDYGFAIDVTYQYWKDNFYTTR